MALHFTDTETAILSAAGIMTPTGIPATLDTLARLAMYRDELGGHLARRVADDAALSAWHAVGEAEADLEPLRADWSPEGYLDTCKELREIAHRFDRQAQTLARDPGAITTDREKSIRFAVRCALRKGRNHHRIHRLVSDGWGFSTEVCAIVDSEIARNGQG